MKKLLYSLLLIPLIFLCSAKDIADSFDHYKIVIAVADTSSLNATYEKPISRMLRLAGHSVKLAYADSLDSATGNAVGSTKWSSFDLAVIPNFSVCPTIDTSKANGIGEVPLICLEDSLWDDIGFTVDTLIVLTSTYIKLRNVTDPITSIFSTASDQAVYYNPGHVFVTTSPSVVAAMDSAGLLTPNIIAKAYGDSLVTIAIDTINSKKRIAFGLYDMSTLGFGVYSGWTLFDRCVGRLVEAEQDSILRISQQMSASTGNDFFAIDEANFSRLDSAYKTYFETNMHDYTISPMNRATQTTLTFWEEDLGISSSQSWSTLDLFVSTCVTSNWTGFKDTSKVFNIPALDITKGMFWSSYVDGTTELYQDTLKKISVRNHPIITGMSKSEGDTLLIGDIFTYPYYFSGISEYAIYCPFAYSDSLSPTKSKPILILDTDEGDKYTALVSTQYFWVSFGIINSDFNIFNANGDIWDLTKQSLIWLLEKDMLFPPSNVSVTALSDSSIKISWTDNSDNEDGFAIYLQDGGNYSGSDRLVSIVAANVVADTLYPFWPPNTLWKFDVGNWNASKDTVLTDVPDSCYTLAKVPQKPIVYALSDTSINIITNGYVLYDLFTDTTLTTNPVWARPAGTWRVEKPYNRLKTWASNSTISTRYDSCDKDLEIRAMFHFNDSLRLNSQWVKFYFTSNSNAGTGNGYYVYADSAVLQVRKQTGGVDVDTLYDGTYTGNYKWRTLRITNDYTRYPTYKAINWGLFLDGALQGTFTDTTYQSVSYLVLKSSHTRHWWDNIYIKHYPYPAGNSSSTTYAIYDSVQNKYMTAAGAWGASEVWQTYSGWDSTNGTTGYTSAYTLKRIRVKAKNSE